MNIGWTKESDRILETATDLEKYNRWLIGIFSPHFGKSILEIGSGRGALSKLLPSKSIVILSDVNQEYLQNLQKIFTDPVIKLDIENEAPKNLHGKLDTIFSSNVFEHLKDDEKAMRNCFKLLEPGGKLLLFVPACPSIFGQLDREMGHFRRYTKKELRSKAEKSGFKVQELYYANLPGFFTWWGRGVFLGNVLKNSNKKNTDNFFGSIFDRLITPLIYLEKNIHPPFGQSLVLVAEKD